MCTKLILTEITKECITRGHEMRKISIKMCNINHGHQEKEAKAKEWDPGFSLKNNNYFIISN